MFTGNCIKSKDCGRNAEGKLYQGRIQAGTAGKEAAKVAPQYCYAVLAVLTEASKLHRVIDDSYECDPVKNCPPKKAPKLWASRYGSFSLIISGETEQLFDFII